MPKHLGAPYGAVGATSRLSPTSPALLVAMVDAAVEALRKAQADVIDALQMEFLWTTSRHRQKH